MGSRWIGAVALSLLFAVGASGMAAAKSSMPPTHSMALDAVADTVAADLLKGATFPAGRPVVLVAPAPGDTLGLLTQRLMERMKALGVSVRLARSEAQAPGMEKGVPPTGNPSVIAPGLSSL
jgi:hypothetical protein